MSDRIIAAHYCGHWLAIYGEGERWELVGHPMARRSELVPAHPNTLTSHDLTASEWYAVDDIDGEERAGLLAELLD
jgi:hypothetical protein